MVMNDGYRKVIDELVDRWLIWLIWFYMVAHGYQWLIGWKCIGSYSITIMVSTKRQPEDDMFLTHCFLCVSLYRLGGSVWLSLNIVLFSLLNCV